MNEIILYAVLALIVGAMLFSVLGRDVGHGADTPLDPQGLVDRFRKPVGEEVPPDFDGPAAEGLKKISDADPGFTVAGFLDGAKAAYGMILEAYADGDRELLGKLLSKQVQKTYFAALDAREKKELTQTTDLARLLSAEIVGADCSDRTGRIDVAYTADLATMLADTNGDIVDGDPDVLSRVSEVWSFERTLASKNPNWLLASVEPHEVEAGQEAGPDHSPDTV